ncbi:carbamoyltransferase C-terminal domain-containing protein [Streptomyces sp. NPDC086077]|uniref:carbamoyltransferase C-terminal domain-containing protein n=1 Tax=Streptomyces sp. NPDC086077 TaxID=3154862 RepID=UPI00342B581F
MADIPRAMPCDDLRRGWSDDDLRAWLDQAAIPYDKPDDNAETVAEELARDGVVAWFQGRKAYGPCALGHRSQLPHPGQASAHGIIVTAPQTRLEDTARASRVAPDLPTSVRAVPAGPPPWTAPATEAAYDYRGRPR